MKSQNKIIAIVVLVFVFCAVFSFSGFIHKVAEAQVEDTGDSEAGSYGAGSQTGDGSGTDGQTTSDGSGTGGGIGSLVWNILGFNSADYLSKKAMELVGIKRPTVGEAIMQIGSSAIAWVLYYVVYTLALLAGTVFAFGGWLIGILLEFNMKVLELPTVLMGWEIMLNIANLGFVLAIIIIAFATIFRSQSYAMKQTLWKLVMAALLVNFSFVIAGGFIETSHLFANFFLNEATPTVGGQQNGVQAFAANLTNSLAPQKLLQIKDIKTIGEGGDLKKVIQKTAGDPAILIITMTFVLVFTFLGAIVFLAIAVMLLIRFVALGILLILAPIVWLFWIFPATKHLWDQWWGKFLRWTFFAPIMLFFLYLVVKTNEKKAEYFAPVLGASGSSSPAGDAGKVLNDYLLMRTPGLVLGEMVIMLGLMIGGLIVANKMGIHFANTAMDMAKRAGKGAGAWAGRKGIQLGTAPLRAKWGKDEEGKPSSLGEKAVKLANKNWLTRHTLGYAARGITRLETAGGENILKQHAGESAKMSNADLKASLLTAGGPRKIAVTKELQKRKLLGDVDAKNLITEGNQSLFGRFRQGASWGDIEHGAKMNTKMAEMLKNLEKNPSVGTTAFLQDLNKETHNFVKTYKGKDIEQSAIKDLYSGKAKLGLSKETIDDFSEMFTDALAAVNYQMTPKVVPTMNAQERDTFSGIYQRMVDRPGREKAKKAWENTMNNYGAGFSAETPAPGTTPPPTS